MKPIFRILIVLAIIALVFVANYSRRNSKITGITVQIDYAGCDTLVSPDRIVKLIHHELPHLTALLVKEVNTDDVEKAVAISPYLADNEASISLGRKIVVKATQRKPIIQVFYRGTEFYLDREGRCVPMSSEGCCDVIVANGTFKQKLGQGYINMDLQKFLADSVKQDFGITKVWQLACFLYDHPKYGNMFDQLYIDNKCDLYLVPKSGNFVINVGSPEDLDAKFAHLDALYAKALPQVGWDYYSIISLKFKNQVVCTKRQKE